MCINKNTGDEKMFEPETYELNSAEYEEFHKAINESSNDG